MSGSEEKNISQEMAYEKCVEKDHEIFDIQSVQEDLSYKLRDCNLVVHSTILSIKNSSDAIIREMGWIEEDRALMEINVELSAQALQEVKIAGDMQAEKQKLCLDAKKAEIAKKKEQSAILKEERVYLQAVLKKKKSMFAKLQKDATAEASRLKMQKQTLSDLLLSSESEKQNRFMAIHNSLEMKFGMLNDSVGLERAENEKIRMENAALSAELAALESDRRSKLESLAEFESKVNRGKAKCEHAERKNQKIKSKIQSSRQKQVDDIARMEQEIAERRTAYENLKKKNDSLNVRIEDELGNAGSLEETMSRAESQLGQLNVECSELENSVEAAKNQKISNENTLKKWNGIKYKLCNEANEFRNKSSPTENQQPERLNRSVQSPSARRISIPTNRTTARLHRQQALSEPEPTETEPTEQNGPLIRTADSSLSWADTSEQNSEEILRSEVIRLRHAASLFMKYNM